MLRRSTDYIAADKGYFGPVGADVGSHVPQLSCYDYHKNQKKWHRIEVINWRNIIQGYQGLFNAPHGTENFVFRSRKFQYGHHSEIDAIAYAQE